MKPRLNLTNRRVLLFLLYWGFGISFSIFDAAYGVLMIFFPWAALVLGLLLLPSILISNKLGFLDTTLLFGRIGLVMSLYFVAVLFVVLSVLYVFILSQLNVSTGKNSRYKFPWLTFLLHLSGIFCSIPLYISFINSDKVNLLPFAKYYQMFAYPILAIATFLYIYIDWRLAREIAEGEKQEAENRSQF